MLRRPVESANAAAFDAPSAWLGPGVELSVRSVGDSYDNALVETINGLYKVYKAEVIHRRGPWRSFEAVEFAMLESVDWFNNRRPLELIGKISSAKVEKRYCAMQEEPFSFKRNSLRKTRSDSAQEGSAFAVHPPKTYHSVPTLFRGTERKGETHHQGAIGIDGTLLIRAPRTWDIL